VKRTAATISVAVAVAASLLAAGAQGRGPSARAARAAVVQLRSTSLGRILVDGSGFTLYEHTNDPRGRDLCASSSECIESWPAYTSRGRPTPGRGVRASLLSTIALPGGARQVTYAGHPLYLYAGDSGPGETGYVGADSFGGRWLAVGAGGRAVR